MNWQSMQSNILSKKTVALMILLSFVQQLLYFSRFFIDSFPKKPCPYRPGQWINISSSRPTRNDYRWS